MPMLAERLKQFVVDVLVWTFLAIVFLSEPGEYNALPKLVLYAAIGFVFGALPWLFKSLVGRIIIRLSMLWLWLITLGMWPVAIIVGVILGVLVVDVIWRLGKAVFAARRREHDASSRKPS